MLRNRRHILHCDSYCVCCKINLFHKHMLNYDGLFHFLMGGLCRVIFNRGCASLHTLLVIWCFNQHCFLSAWRAAGGDDTHSAHLDTWPHPPSIPPSPLHIPPPASLVATHAPICCPKYANPIHQCPEVHPHFMPLQLTSDEIHRLENNVAGLP